ncbi:MAG: hypothetical protein RLZZ342_519 [Candidatus Parcubacteria bacterium]|jgi:hypothetical protein
MKKNILIAAVVTVTLSISWLIFSLNSPVSKSVSTHHYALPLSTTNDITCTYPQTLYSSYFREEVKHELPPPETSPIIITFSDFEAELVKAKFIDATQTISEVSLIKIVDSPEKFVFVEGSGDPYITVHTIYKTSGVATLGKSASLLGTPVGSMAMGTCVSN